MTSTEIEVATRTRVTVSTSDFLQQTGEPSRVTRSQMYYWSPRWQDGEQESLRELKAGHGVSFDSGDDLVSWLLADDED